MAVTVSLSQKLQRKPDKQMAPQLKNITNRKRKLDDKPVQQPAKKMKQNMQLVWLATGGEAQIFASETGKIFRIEQNRLKTDGFLSDAELTSSTAHKNLLRPKKHPELESMTKKFGREKFETSTMKIGCDLFQLTFKIKQDFEDGFMNRGNVAQLFAQYISDMGYPNLGIHCIERT